MIKTIYKYIFNVNTYFKIRNYLFGINDFASTMYEIFFTNITRILKNET